MNRLKSLLERELQQSLREQADHEKALEALPRGVPAGTVVMHARRRSGVPELLQK